MKTSRKVQLGALAVLANGILALTGMTPVPALASTCSTNNYVIPCSCNANSCKVVAGCSATQSCVTAMCFGITYVNQLCQYN
jgi:hypothetical protein